MSQGDGEFEDPDDLPDGLEDEDRGQVCNFGIIEIHPPGGGAPMIIDFEVISHEPLTTEEMEEWGHDVAAHKIGMLAQYPDWAKRFGYEADIQVFPTGHTYGC